MNNNLRQGNPDLKFCPGCERIFPRNDAAFFKNRARGDGLSVLCKECHSHNTHGGQQQKRQQVFALLGNECTRCGFSDVRALQIDHVHGNGRADRGNVSPSKYYQKILAHPETFQILCANCNVIKRMENGEHAQPAQPFPDEVKVSSEQKTEICKRRKGNQDYAVIGAKVHSWWTPERRAARGEEMRRIRAKKKWSSNSTSLSIGRVSGQ